MDFSLFILVLVYVLVLVLALVLLFFVLVFVLLLVLVLTDGYMMTYLIGFHPLPVLTNAVGWTKIFHILPHLPAKCQH